MQGELERRSTEAGHVRKICACASSALTGCSLGAHWQLARRMGGREPHASKRGRAPQGPENLDHAHDFRLHALQQLWYGSDRGWYLRCILGACSGGRAGTRLPSCGFASTNRTFEALGSRGVTKCRW